MNKILIFGAGGLSEELLSIIDKDKVEISAFIDNDINKKHLRYYDKCIISPDEIKKYPYDYIVIASQYYKDIIQQLVDLKVSKDKILNFGYLFEEYCQWSGDRGWDNYCDNELLRQFEKLKLLNNNIDGIATGISYSKFSLDESLFINKMLNFSLPSQDIFYDFKILEKILSEYTIKNLKYALIGLTYYSFDYDLSRSIRRHRCIQTYYPLLQQLHNCEKNEDNAKDARFRISTLNLDNIIKSDWVEILNKKHEDQEYEINFDTYWNNSLDKLNIREDYKWETGRKVAVIDSNKDYPYTRDENKKIFNNLINLLNKKGVEPIIIIFPASIYYSCNISHQTKEKFYNIIAELKQYNKFRILDCFTTDILDKDKDFCDIFHVNRRGAEKFTQYIIKALNLNSN